MAHPGGKVVQITTHHGRHSGAQALVGLGIRVGQLHVHVVPGEEEAGLFLVEQGGGLQDAGIGGHLVGRAAAFQDAQRTGAVLRQAADGVGAQRDHEIIDLPATFGSGRVVDTIPQ